MELNCIWKETTVLLPATEQTDFGAWSVIACDQYTSEGEYWERAGHLREGKCSTLDLILPEVYLNRAEEEIPRIHRKMKEYLAGGIFKEYPETAMYVERTLLDGSIRRGIVGAIDLEQYDYRKGSKSLIRATEQTVLERIPPRVAVRRGAVLESPHVLLLIDDPGATVIEPCAKHSDTFEKLYEFDLMLGGGHIIGRKLSGSESERIRKSLAKLATPEVTAEKYGDVNAAPLLFAVGDGNHSLASAKAYYEELKQSLGEEVALQHPARYALAEFVNLHDPSLCFEPIYRVLFEVDPCDVLRELTAYAEALRGNLPPQSVTYRYAGHSGVLEFSHPMRQLTVGTLQEFLDRYVTAHPEAGMDYIHGEDSLIALAEKQNSIGFLFDGMEKSQLFRTVMFDGALPRKTFSMGHAQEKRYYLECRKIEIC